MATDEAGRIKWSQNERIAAYLRDGILTGEFPPDSKLPSTRELRAQFGASPQAIFNATQTLVREGLVYSHKGKGIIVRSRRQETIRPADYKEPAAPGEAYSWLTTAEQRGMRPGSVLRDVGTVKAPVAVATILNASEALMREQMLTLDGAPAELVRSYYPLGLCSGTAMMQKRRIKGGTPRLLADLGYPPLRCVDKVSARLPTQEEYEALELPTKLPVLRTLRVVHSVDDRAIEVSISAKAGHLFEVEYEF